MAGVVHDTVEVGASVAASDSSRCQLQGCQVVFILPHLGPGGAQRVVSLVANQWAAQGLSVGLITLLGNTPDSHYVDPRVRRVNLDEVDLGDERYSRAGFRIVAILRKFITGKQSRRGLRSLARMVASKLALILFQVSAILPTFKLAPTLFQTSAIQSRDSKSLQWKKVEAFLLWLARLAAGRNENRLRLVLEASRPPRVISFLTKTNIYTALAAWNLSIHVVVSERNDPDLQYLEPVWQRMRAFSYRRAAVVTSNADGVLKKMLRFCDGNRLQLLPNPLALPPVTAADADRQPRFIVVARLVEQKGIDVLLAAFAKIGNKLPDWSVEIVGDGPLRNELCQLARQLGIAERVNFHGHVRSPLEYLRQASVFVLPSRFEGMPNSLLEAMASGLPAIVTNASPGPLEVVLHEDTGLVVPVENADALAASMLRLARDAVYRSNLGRAARSLVSKHSWPEVEAAWREVLRLPFTAG